MSSTYLVVFSVVNMYMMSVVSGMTSDPENAAVLVGQTVELHFIRPTTGSSFVSWYTHVSGEPQILYMNGSYQYSGSGTIGDRSTTTITSNDTHVLHTLKISDIELADGGKYSVDDILAAPKVESFAEVVVLESNMDCSIQPNPVEVYYEVTVVCTVSYQGRWGPVMTCAATQMTNTATGDMSEAGLSQYNYTGTALGGIPTDTLSCEAHFESPTTEEYTKMAVNIPDWTSSWTGSFDIYYPATDISVSPNLTEYEVGDSIMCTASGGNPAPSYEWVNEDSLDTLSTTDTFTINEEMAGYGHNVTCFAKTTINENVYELLEHMKIYVNELPTTTTTTTTTTSTTMSLETTTIRKEKVDEKLLIIIIVATVAGLLTLVLVITLIVCCIKKVTKSAKLGERV